MLTGRKILVYGVGAVVGAYFLFLGLIEAKVFLAPLVTAILLALLLLPLSQFMERKGLSCGLTSLLNTLLLLLITFGFLTLLSFQIKNFADDWPQIKESLQPTIEQVTHTITANTPLDKESMAINDGLFKDSKTVADKAGTIIGAVMGYMGNFLLTFIYVFFLLHYRERFKKCMLHFFPKERRKNVHDIVVKSAQVVPKYLLGRLMLIGFLSVLYAVGLGISGVDNFILISVLAAVFSLVPYIGNIVGVAMAIILGYIGTGDTVILIGIIVTFSVAQFIESYILEPYVVGNKVDVHPFIVILAVVVGNLVWGLIGMVLAIPIVAILAVLMLHIPLLKPLGVLFSNEDFE
ncbi:AI-2E family transporter [Marixanthomonas spongiae]|uniref:AI-2E family transporter n=1 Tax=Marixanthomonas spongiae TaxID=2174845 RepID=A0A2U0I586_9FLAO|nr:AI-2E family transporter [Marixanthomonas spongiae]PVW16262.1 AI-2E family transporter [Marixanthomonas spongiae]